MAKMTSAAARRDDAFMFVETSTEPPSRSVPTAPITPSITRAAPWFRRPGSTPSTLCQRRIPMETRARSRGFDAHHFFRSCLFGEPRGFGGRRRRPLDHAALGHRHLRKRFPERLLGNHSSFVPDGLRDREERGRGVVFHGWQRRDGVQHVQPFDHLPHDHVGAIQHGARAGGHRHRERRAVGSGRRRIRHLDKLAVHGHESLFRRGRRRASFDDEADDPHLTVRKAVVPDTSRLEFREQRFVGRAAGERRDRRGRAGNHKGADPGGPKERGRVHSRLGVFVVLHRVDLRAPIPQPLNALR